MTSVKKPYHYTPNFDYYQGPILFFEKYMYATIIKKKVQDGLRRTVILRIRRTTISQRTLEIDQHTDQIAKPKVGDENKQD